MLSYRINRNEIGTPYNEIELVDNIGYINESGVTFYTNNNNITENSIVRFKRSEGDYILFKSNYHLSSSVISDSGNCFTIDTINSTYLKVEKIETFSSKFWVDDAYPYNFISFSFIKTTPHNVVKNRKEYTGDFDYIKHSFIGDDYVKDTERNCAGDFILYEDKFLYQAPSVTSEGAYDLGISGRTFIGSDCFKCFNDVNLYITFTIADLDEELSGETYGTDWYVDENTLILEHCIVPVMENGMDDEHTLIWQCQNDAISKLISENINSISVSTDDRRFYDYSGDVVTLVNSFISDTESSNVSLVTDTLSLFNVFERSNDVGIDSEYEVNDYINREIENNKNAIIDYEKQVFTPVYFEGDGFDNVEDDKLNDVYEINFNLHLRDRWEYNEGERTKLTDDWKTNDDKFWNNYAYDLEMFSGEGGVKVIGDLSINDADLIGNLGFDDDDIYYRKKKVSKSFLRLLFYDSNNRMTQNLIFTSTIFLDDAKLYDIYVNLINSGLEPNEHGIVLTEGRTRDGKRLAAQFTCMNKYDNNNSSEGFYLYLFPSLLEGLPEIDNIDPNIRQIYMKVEFNNAKYGYRIPLTMPHDELSDKIYNPSDYCFPVNYLREKENCSSYIDTNALFSDMYIKLYIKYDALKKRYVWMLPRTKDSLNGANGKLTFNLFEPKVNGGKNDSYYIDEHNRQCVKKKYSGCTRTELDDAIENEPYYIRILYDVLPNAGENVRLYTTNPEKMESGTTYIKSIYVDGNYCSPTQRDFNISEGEHDVYFFMESIDKKIPNSMFAGNHFVNGIKGIKGFNSVGKFSFAGCDRLEFANISGITDVLESAFQGDIALRQITANTVTNIEKAAFSRTDITKVPSLVYGVKFGDFAFSRCYNLVDIEDNEKESLYNYITGNSKYVKGLFMDCNKFIHENNTYFRNRYSGIVFEGIGIEEQFTVRQNLTTIQPTNNCSVQKSDKNKTGGKIGMLFSYTDHPCK